jgi:predicted nucleic acid-binding protein
LARVEVVRAVSAHGPAVLVRARRVLGRIDLVHIDDDLLDDAATLAAGVLRSLDAIHLAAARVFGDDLRAVVTYDDRMARSASPLGLPVVAPR